MTATVSFKQHSLMRGRAGISCERLQSPVLSSVDCHKMQLQLLPSKGAVALNFAKAETVT